MSDPHGTEDSGLRLGSVGPYLIERELRRGGMGTVYLARTDAGEPFALKMALRDDAQSTARFAQEIRATRSLEHPGIVSVLDDGVWHGRVWYVMDYVSEVNLADVLAVHGTGSPDDIGGLVTGVIAGQLATLPVDQRRGLAQPTALAVLRRVVDAVAHAHARGVLHRDLKPSNILLAPEGDPVLADFGVARDLASTLRLTADHEVVGTYTYIAPEQLAGEEIDERADVYALGAMLYECLTGHPPPRRRHGCERLRFDRAIPPDLRRIVYRALEPEPQRRTRSAAMLAADLRRFERGEPVHAEGPGVPRMALFLLQRHIVLSSLGAALVVVVLLLVLLLGLDEEGVEAWAPLVSQGEGEAEVVRWQDALHAARTVGRVQLPPARGVRLAAVLDAADSSGSAVFLAATAGWTDGYVASLGGQRATVVELRRGDELLWLGPVDPASGTERELALERLDDRVAVAVDGRELVAVVDPLPLVGGWAGVVQEHAGTDAIPAIGLTSVPPTSHLPRDWFALRLAAAALRAPGEAGREALLRAEADLTDLLRRGGEDDARHREWLLRRAAVRSALDGGLEEIHAAELATHAGDLADRVVYHQHQLLAAASSGALDSLHQRAEDAAYHLDQRELEVLACWADGRLAGPARRTLLERLLPRLDDNPPLLCHLHWRLARHNLDEYGDLAACRRELEAAADQDAGDRAAAAARRAADLALALALGRLDRSRAARERLEAPGGGEPGVRRRVALLTGVGLEPALLATMDGGDLSWLVDTPEVGDPLRLLLRRAGEAPPVGDATLVAQQPGLTRLVLGDLQDPARAAATRAVLAARLAAAPHSAVLARWARAVVRGDGHGADLALALALHVAHDEVPPTALVDAASGQRRELLRELLLARAQPPRAQVEAVDPIDRLLELIAAVRCLELGATDAGRRRLHRLMDVADPVRWAAEGLLRGHHE